MPLLLMLGTRRLRPRQRLRRAGGKEQCERYIRSREGAEEGRRALGVVAVCSFLCLIYVSSLLTDFYRNPNIENHEDHRWSTGGQHLGNLHEEHTTKECIMEGEDGGLDLDQAQSVVERLRANGNGHQEQR